jgi:NAD(P)-dependent dehydrogenase (short-subunit alcohol dehydrogenase family)
VCLRLPRQGAKVAVADLKAAGARNVAEEIRAAVGQVATVALDVREANQVAGAIETSETTFGIAQILVTYAGMASSKRSSTPIWIRGTRRSGSTSPAPSCVRRPQSERNYRARPGIRQERITGHGEGSASRDSWICN